MKYEVATIFDNNHWVKTKARILNIEKEIHIIKELDKIMRDSLHKYNFIGVSSNNIYWDLTDIPVRQILIPSPTTNEYLPSHSTNEYISLINPKILECNGKKYSFIESCGSIPNKCYNVERHSHILISGYNINNDFIQLKYGSKHFLSRYKMIYPLHRNKQFIVQHEIDHLDGITLQDKGRQV